MTDDELEQLEAQASRLGEECFRLPQLRLIAEVRRLRDHNNLQQSTLRELHARMKTKDAAVESLKAKLEEQYDAGYAAGMKAAYAAHVCPE